MPHNPNNEKFEGIQYPLIQLLAEVKGWTRYQTESEMLRAYRRGLDWTTTSCAKGTQPGSLAAMTSGQLLYQLRAIAIEKGWNGVAREIDRRISELRDRATRSRPVHGFPRALVGVETFRRTSNSRNQK